MSGASPLRALFWHAESDCYWLATTQAEIEESWASSDGLVSDVTDVEVHEEEWRKRQRDTE